MNYKRLNLVLSIAATALCGGFCQAHADAFGTAFTYQGRLVTANGPASGTYELTFNLYDAAAGGTPIAPPVGPTLITVTGGVFTVTLDFGPVFQGDLRWLEILARTNDPGATFTILPRQPLRPAPNAIFAAHAASADALPGLTVTTTLQEVQAERVDQSQPTGGQPIRATVIWQSFTAGWSGNLARVKVTKTATTEGGTFSIYSGEGPPWGGMLYTANATAGDEIIDPMFPPYLVGGTKYTLIWNYPGGATFEAGAGDPYPSGRCETNFVAFAGDLVFTNVMASYFISNYQMGLGTQPETAGALSINGPVTAPAFNGTFTGNGAGLVMENENGAFRYTGWPPGGGIATLGVFIGANNNGPQLRFQGAPGGFVDIGQNGLADFVIEQSDKPVVVVSTNCDVGIGTANPVSKLEVNGTITASNFVGRIAASQLTGTISSNNLGAGSITTVMLAAGAVTTGALADGAVTTAKLANGNVTTAKLADGSVTTAKLAVGSVTTGALAAGAVTSNQLAAGAVTAANIATVTSSNWFHALRIANPTPATYEMFGHSVAAVGSDRVLIGARQDDTGGDAAGAAYLFSTGGTLLTTFTNPTPAASDFFGTSVAAVGTDRLLIGANCDNTGANDAGAAYLFSTGGTLLTTFTNPTPAASDVFGTSVAAVGPDRVLIGAHQDDTGANDAGAAYLFSTSGALLTTFTNPTPASGDFFGHSVAAVGIDRVLIGAYQDDTGPTDAGVAYLFSASGTLLTTFTNPTPAAYDVFGYSVAAVGTDRVLIAAQGDDTGANDAGVAYLFSTTGALLTTFTNPAPAAGDQFGYSVAAVGTDRVLIGAQLDDTGADNAGAAYLFSTNGALLATFANPAPTSGDSFGYSVAAVGSGRVLIGAHFDDTGADGAGAAHLFSLETYTSAMVAGGAGADSSIGVWTSVGDNVFRLGGNVGIGTTSPQYSLEVIGEAAVTALNLTSDRNAKEQFAPVKPREVLDAVLRLPITEWQFKDQPGVRHLGPVAQDFHAAFDLGRDDKHIATVDADGVALAAIQGLNAKLDASDAQIARLRAENESLAARLAEIERKLGLTGSSQPSKIASP